MYTELGEKHQEIDALFHGYILCLRDEFHEHEFCTAIDDDNFLFVSESFVILGVVDLIFNLVSSFSRW